MCLLPSSETRYGKTSPPSTVSGHKKEEERCMAPPKPRLQGSGSQQPRKLHHSLLTTQQQQEDPRCSLSLSLSLSLSPPKYLKTVNKNPGPQERQTRKQIYRESVTEDRTHNNQSKKLASTS
jgi:hypothetical protein